MGWRVREQNELVPCRMFPKMQTNMRKTVWFYPPLVHPHPAFRHNSSPPSFLAQPSELAEDRMEENTPLSLLKPAVYRKNLSCGKDLRKEENLLNSVLISVCCTHQIPFFIQHIWVWLSTVLFWHQPTSLCISSLWLTERAFLQQAMFDVLALIRTC